MTSGVSARELLTRGGNLDRLAARELEAWLIDAGLAVRDGRPNLLVPTAKAIGLAGCLEFLGE